MTEEAGVLRGRTITILRPSQERLDRLAVWFQAEHASLLRFAYFVGGDRAGAEDLVQETFVRLYRAGGRVEDETIGAYARTTLVNLARSRFRRRALERRVALPAAGAIEAVDVATRDEMWRALLTLSPRQRACVALKFYEDMSEKDIAAALGMSAGSVKKHTDRALSKLRERLGKES